MKPFFRPERLWPAGKRLLHVYIQPDLSRDQELGDLIRQCRHVLRPIPATDKLVPDEWLHVTVDAIGKRYSHVEITARMIQEFVHELRARLSTFPAFTVLVGSPIAYTSAVIVDIDDVERNIEQLTTQVRLAAASTWGGDAVSGAYTFPPHLTLAYAQRRHDSEDIARALFSVRPSHAPMTIDRVHLVSVEQDPVHAVYRWNVVHTFPLLPWAD